MGSGKLVVFEGIYGSGRLVVEVVNRLREVLVAEGVPVVEADSPDAGRVEVMGAGELDTRWRHGLFEADFLLELAARARVCALVREERARGALVLCKHFTLGSAVHARLAGHDWEREELDLLERRARSMGHGGEVVADRTIFVDVRPAVAEADVGDRVAAILAPGALARQRELYLREMDRLPPGRGRTVAAGSLEGVLAECLASVRELLAAA